MKILDRYIIQEWIAPFMFGIFAFTCVLAGSDVLFSSIRLAIKYTIPIKDFLSFFLYQLPLIMVLSFPMSTLLATILVFGRLGNDLEILALRAGGINVLRLVLPVVFIGFFVSLLTIWFNETIVPHASYSAELLLDSYKNNNKPTIKKNINYTEYQDGFPARIINVPAIDNGIFKNATIVEYDNGQLIRLIRADTGRLLPTGGWEFYDGVMHSYLPEDKKRVTVIEFEKEYIDIQLSPLQLQREKDNVEQMTRKELKQKIIKAQKTGLDSKRLIMDYHMKLSIPFASLIYSILGVSLGLRPHRSSSASGVMLSLLAIFSYIVLLSIGTILGLSGLMPPLLAAWLPNIVTGITGVLLLNRATLQ